MLKTKKEITYIIAIIIVLLLIVIAILIGLHMNNADSSSTSLESPVPMDAEEDTGFSLIQNVERLSFENVQESIQKMGVLVTAKYQFTEVVNYSKLKSILGIDLGVTESSYIGTYDGKVEAGVDFEKATVEAEMEGSTVRVTVNMPKPTITSIEIFPDSFVLYSEKTGLANPLSVVDYNKTMSGLRDTVEKKAQERGLLKEAEEQATNMTENLVKSLFSDVDCSVNVIYK